MRIERPKRNVARSWGLPAGSTFVAMPHAVLRLLAREKMDARHTMVVLAIADLWHSDAGTSFQTSLRDLSVASGMPYQNVNRALQGLEEKGLLTVTRAHGKPLVIDLLPLLRAINPKAPRKPRTVPPTEQSTVPPTEQNCSAGVPLAEQSFQAQKRSSGFTGNGVMTVPPTEHFQPQIPETSETEKEEVAAPGGEQSAANATANGERPPSTAERETIAKALELLTGPKRHPRAIGSESYGQTQQRVAKEILDAEAGEVGKNGHATA